MDKPPFETFFAWRFVLTATLKLMIAVALGASWLGAAAGYALHSVPKTATSACRGNPISISPPPNVRAQPDNAADASWGKWHALTDF